MFNTYTGWAKFFSHRAKGKHFKAINTCLRLYKEDDGSFRVDRWVGWENENRKDAPFARISPDNTCTFLTDIPHKDNSGKNFVRLVAGFGRAYSDTSRYAAYDHKVRFCSRNNANVPLTTGLKLDIATQKVLYSVPDVKAKTNRTKAKPVYEYTNKVVAMMELLMRIDGFTDGVAPNRHGRWWKNRCVLNEAEQLTLEDEKLAEVAELAYRQAAARVFVPPKNYWETQDGRPVWKKRTDQEVKAVFNAAILRTARAHLHVALKRRTDCYDKEVVDQAL